MCSSGYSFPFLLRMLPSCPQWETQTAKTWWMPAPLFLSLAVTFCPHGSITVTAVQVDGCMLDGSTPFLCMAALQVRCRYSRDISLLPIYFPTCFVDVSWSKTTKSLKNAKNTCEALYNKIRNVSLWCALFFFLGDLMLWED